MVTWIYGVLLAVSILVIMYMAQKNYENIDTQYWTIVVLVPMVVLGYWLKTQAETVEAAKICFSYIYLDSTVLLTIVIFCIMRFMGLRIYPWQKILGYGTAFLHMLLIWVCVRNNLYYGTMTLIDTGNGIATKMTPGPLKIIHWIYLAVVLVIIGALMAKALIKRGTYSRRTLMLYSILTGIGLVCYLLETLLDVDFSVLPFVYVVADILIALNYDHAHTHDIACLISEQQKYHGTKGYVAFDLNGCYLSCNEKIYEYLPELKEQVVDAKLPENSRLADIFYTLIENHKNNVKHHRKFQAGDVVCRCEISEFTIRKDGNVQGYLFDVRDVTEEEHVLSVMKDYNETLNTEVFEKTENIRAIQEKIVLGLANMIENRDNNTGGHVKRTSDVIKILVKEIQKQGIYEISDTYAKDIVRAAPMHDLGKISIENSILLKPGKLTDEEYAVMKTHAAKSGEIVKIILQDVEEEHFVKVAYNVARYHHERWDGRGYPEGLVGDMIPLEARIMAVADVYDALVSARCYKGAGNYEDVANTMMDNMGNQFDPKLLPVFIGCRSELETYYQQSK
ncbi:MAG: HD domain-containing protein [Lachnospiraceae bacterium]|nr:HD domain-containing protein [Lachnospiraceae bacterium]